MTTLKSIVIILIAIFDNSVHDQNVSAYKILAIFPHTGKSHHIVVEPLLRALAEKGHDLTVISHYPLKDSLPNYRDISLAGSRHLNLHICDFDDFKFFSGIGTIIRHAMSTYELFDLGNLNCEAMLTHQNVKDLMKSDETFDLILTEQFNSDCSFGIIKKFSAPVVGITAHVPMPWTRGRFGIPENPSYIPSHFLKHLRYPSFLETIESIIINNYYKIAYYINTHVFEYRFLKDGYLESRFDLDVIANNFSLLLVTTYFSLHGTFPQGPNVVDIGGVHLPKKIGRLDKETEKFLNDSGDGVIYFSMGSMIRGKSLPPEKLKAFQGAFSKLPYRVLWKWEDDVMPWKTDQIIIKPWMPQYEIINHPKVKLFISHGGLLGLTEAVNCAVPVLIIPFFGDQFVNGAAAEESGLGRVLPYEDINEESVLNVLKHLLSQETQNRVKRISSIWRDRPMSPLDTAIYWIEHVARHGGDHLRPTFADIPLYKYLLLDVILFFTIIFTILIYLIVRQCGRMKVKTVLKNKKE